MSERCLIGDDLQMSYQKCLIEVSEEMSCRCLIDVLTVFYLIYFVYTIILVIVVSSSNLV